MTRLELNVVTLKAGHRTLCRELSVKFHAGENWAILGANGSGKTTLLHAMAGLRTPDGGSVLLDGTPVLSWPTRERARRIGLLFQDYVLTFPSTVIETVLTGRHPHMGRFEFEGAKDRSLAETSLADVDMAELADRSLSTLSGGERRRVEIATVLAQDAPICLWDEPANHLDLRHRTEILSHLARRAARPAHLNLFVLHDVNVIPRLCSHTLLFLADGTVRAGKTTEILTANLLEQAYGCPFREIVDGDERYYLPR